MIRSTMQSILAVSVLAFTSFNAAAAPAPLGTNVCAGGAATAATSVIKKANDPAGPYLVLHNLLTTAQINSLEAEMIALTSQTPGYDNLLADAVNLKNAINTATGTTTGRVVITLPDGTVVVDTGKPNNTYADYLAKAINENHNSRAAIMEAQMFPCGLGVETKFSSTDLSLEKYVARRIGNATSTATYAATYMNSKGTVRISYR